MSSSSLALEHSVADHSIWIHHLHQSGYRALYATTIRKIFSSIKYVVRVQGRAHIRDGHSRFCDLRWLTSSAGYPFVWTSSSPGSDPLSTLAFARCAMPQSSSWDNDFLNATESQVCTLWRTQSSRILHRKAQNHRIPKFARIMLTVDPHSR